MPPRPSPITIALTQAFSDIEMFSRHILRRPLRPYQAEAIRPVVRAVIARDGSRHIWRFPRQSGKNEALAHLDAYLLFLYQRQAGATIVHVAPTYEPQAVIALSRILELTETNPFFRGIRRTGAGNEIRFGRARFIALSALPRQHPPVGPTASLLLQKDEAQDMEPDYIERVFDPMTTNTHAPHLLTGTARHTQTYLAQVRREIEAGGHGTVHVVNWRDVAAVHPPYGDAVAEVIRRKGERHPIVLSEYENVETDQTSRLFDDRRVSLITQPAPASVPSDAPAVITIDVGGTSLDGQQREHDATVAIAHRITIRDRLPAYHALEYWTASGDNVLDDTPARAALIAWIRARRPVRVLVDASGLGVALASTLSAQLGASLVTPVTITERVKHDMLSGLLALIESGRLTVPPPNQPDGSIHADTARLIAQMRACTHDQRGALTHWGVPSDTVWTHPITGQREDLHDDHLMSLALLGLIADDDTLIRPYFSAQVKPASRPLFTRRHGTF